MAGNTRRHVIESLRRMLAGGQPSDDFSVSVGLVNQFLNGGVAFAMKNQYKEEIQLNGVESIADAVYATFVNLPITKDTITGLYNITLPQQTAGIGAGWDISSFMMVTGSGAKLFGYPITQREMAFLYNGAKGCNDVFFGVVKDKMEIHSCKDLSKYKGRVTMIVTQSTDLDSPMNIPDTYMPIIVDYMTKTLGVMMNMPVDISSDGVDTPKVR